MKNKTIVTTKKEEKQFIKTMKTVSKNANSLLEISSAFTGLSAKDKDGSTIKMSRRDFETLMNKLEKFEKLANLILQDHDQK